MRLLLIRHAESQGNADGIIQGQADFPLSPSGVRQAELLAARLQPLPLDALYTSPLLRASQTAAAISRLNGLPPVPIDASREYDFGVVNGMLAAEAREKYGTVADPSGGPATTFPIYPGEEGRDAFRTRVCAAFLGLEAAHADEMVAVLTHGGPITVFCLSMLGQPYRPRPPFVIDNTSITTIDVRDGRGTVTGLNDTCHLDGAA